MSKPFQLLLIAALLGSAAPVAAQKPAKPPKARSSQPTVRVVFHDSDRGVFRDYYRVHRPAVKPLPPGIIKKLVRGKPLPPGIARTRVPDALLVQLPWRPPGYTFFRVGDRIVLLNANGFVADILDGIF